MILSQMKDIDSIPFDDFRKMATSSLANDARFKYVNTLAKNGGLETVRDIFGLDSSKKKVRDLQDAIRDHEQEIHDLDSAARAVVEIPYCTPPDGVYGLFNAFVHDFIVELKKTYQSQGGRPADMWKIRALQRKYLWGGPKDNQEWSNKEIASSLKMSGESVRKEMESLTESAVAMLEGNPFMGMTPSADMRRAYASFRAELKGVELYPLLAGRLGVNPEDRKTLRFFMDGLGYKFSVRKKPDGELDKEYCLDTGIFGKDGVSVIIRLVGPLEKFFKQDARPLSFETEVMRFMMNKGWSDDECRLAEVYLKADTDEYEWSGPDEFGNHSVAVKWKSLYFANKLVRILYDHRTDHPDDPFMDRDKLIDEYDRRAMAEGMDPFRALTNSVPSNPHIEMAGNGRYRYVNGRKKDKVDLHSELRRLVGTCDGRIAFDDAVSFARTLNPKYSTSTVSRYLKEIGCRAETIDGVSYRIYDKSLDQGGKSSGEDKTKGDKKTRRNGDHLRILRSLAVQRLLYADGRTMTKKELCEQVRKEECAAGMAVSNIYKVFQNDPIFISSGGRKGGKYTLDIDLYNKENGLDGTAGNDADSLDWGRLRSRVVLAAADPLIDDRTGERMYRIMEGYVRGSLDKSNEMWRILKLLDTYLGGHATDSDAELLVYKMYIGLEKYLKLYEYHPNIEGLGHYVQHLQAIGSLPDRVGKYTLDSIPDKIAKMTGLLIANRNNISHNLNEGYNNRQFYDRNIKTALKYYLLVAGFDLARRPSR